MKYFISYKFNKLKFEQTKDKIDPLVALIKHFGHHVFCNLYYENYYTANNYSAKQILDHCFTKMKKCDAIIVYVDGDLGGGMGIECGYAYSLGLEIITCISTESIHISLEGLSSHIIHYTGYSDLCNKLNDYFKMKSYVEFHTKYKAPKKNTNITIHDMKIFVDRRVFNPDPALTHVAQMALDRLKTMRIIDKTILDMGCGTGLLGLYCLIHGAKQVVFTDINEIALKNTQKNVKSFDNTAIIQSDLFEHMPEMKFDIIIYNLPICIEGGTDGSDEEHSAVDGILNMYNKFISQMKKYMNPKAKCLHVFANYGNIPSLKKLYDKHEIHYKESIENVLGVNWSLFMINNKTKI